MTKKKTRGQVWLDEVRASYELTNPAERLLADEIGAVIDAVDSAPSPSEKRLAQTLLSRLLGQLNLPGDADEPRPSMDGKSIRARRASEARWKRVRETEGRTY